MMEPDLSVPEGWRLAVDYYCVRLNLFCAQPCGEGCCLLSLVKVPASLHSKTSWYPRQCDEALTVSFLVLFERIDDPWYAYDPWEPR